MEAGSRRLERLARAGLTKSKEKFREHQNTQRCGDCDRSPCCPGLRSIRARVGAEVESYDSAATLVLPLRRLKEAGGATPGSSA